jgi:hypothetical protein
MLALTRQCTSCGPAGTQLRSKTYELIQALRVVIKILSRISVGGISVVSVCSKNPAKDFCWWDLGGVVCAVVDGCLDLSARATSFFN